MEPKWSLALPAVIAVVLLTAGCLKEVVDPQMDIDVLEVQTKATPPALVNDTLEAGFEYLYIKINLTSENENIDQWANPNEFTVDSNGTSQYNGQYIANLEMRSIGRILIDAGSHKVFWLVFKVPRSETMVYLRFEGTADEPVEVSLPPYSHLP